MADYLTTDTELTSIADAIRTKGGTTASLEYPSEFISAIEAIQTAGTYQSKTVSPSESQQTVSPDTGYDALSSVTVNAVSSTYVGSGIARKSSTDLTASGATVTAPAGYYASAASKSVASGSATGPSSISASSASLSTGTNTLTLSKTVSVTPVVSAGYVSSGTAANSSVSLTASITTKAAATYYPSSTDQSIGANTFTTGKQTIKAVTTSGISAANIKDGATIKVGDTADDDRITAVTGTFTDSSTVSTGQTAAAAGQILSGYSAWVDGAEVKGSIAAKSSSDLTASGATVTAPAGYYASAASKSVASGSATTPATTVTANPSISVNSTTGVITATASATKSVTPTISAGYISAGTAGTITVSGSNTSQLTTQAGTTVNPTESEQTAVAAGKYTLGAVKVGAISKTYVGTSVARKSSADLTASGATVTAPAGYYSSAATKTIGSGTATTPATTVTANPTISINSSTGVVTATAASTKSVTPTVAAGYITAGTAGTITVSGTASTQLTTKAATTYTPGTTNQTIAAATYLTGVQTIKGDANLVASNIASGVSIFGVNGTAAVATPMADPAILYNTVEGWGRSTIKRAVFPSVTEIPSSTFYNATSLNTASFPLATKVGADAFKSCPSLKTIYFPLFSSYQQLFSAFDKFSYNNGTRQYPYLESVCFAFSDPIPTAMFSSANFLRSAYFPNTSAIGSNAFANDTVLFDISFPVATQIKSSAFYNCSALTELTASQFANLTSIGFGAFRGCTSLKRITLSKVQFISDSAFFGCTNIVSARFAVLSAMYPQAFKTGGTNFSSIWLGSTSVVMLLPSTSTSSALFNGFAPWYVHVRASLYQSYMTHSQWKYLSSYIISDYT